jgi:hypothetical protein
MNHEELNVAWLSSVLPLASRRQPNQKQTAAATTSTSNENRKRLNAQSPTTYTDLIPRLAPRQYRNPAVVTQAEAGRLA